MTTRTSSYHHTVVPEAPVEPSRKRKEPSFFQDYVTEDQLHPKISRSIVNSQPESNSHPPRLRTYDPVFYDLYHIRVNVKYSSQVEIDPRCQWILRRCWREFEDKSCLMESPETPNSKRYVECIQQSKDDGSDSWAQKYEVRWLNSDIGYGLFARQDYKKNEVIGFYSGYLSQNTNPDENVDKDYTFDWPNTPYAEHNISIDGLEQGNATRFMNHAPEKNSEKTRNPACNVNAVEFFYQRVPYVIFVASRQIFAGEQLCYDYGPGYWEYKKVTPAKF